MWETPAAGPKTAKTLAARPAVPALPMLNPSKGVGSRTVALLGFPGSAQAGTRTYAFRRRHRNAGAWQINPTSWIFSAQRKR
jgi:hypothetical protein